MEELTLEQIKEKSELEEDIDFENGESFSLTLYGFATWLFIFSACVHSV